MTRRQQRSNGESKSVKELYNLFLVVAGIAWAICFLEAIFQ